jgi:hypothetical protein
MLARPSGPERVADDLNHSKRRCSASMASFFASLKPQPLKKTALRRARPEEASAVANEGSGILARKPLKHRGLLSGPRERPNQSRPCRNYERPVGEYFSFLNVEPEKPF